MQINSITICNFQSYYGEQTLELSKGLNLIIGKGGKGKSKLFNAFYWALFGRIYVTDVGWRQTRGLHSGTNFSMEQHEFINKRALYQASEGEDVKATVMIELTDDKGVYYQIERYAIAKRKPASDWDSANAWDVQPDTLKVTFDTNTGTKTNVDIVAEQVIDKLFPEGIRNYIWFQGETLSSLINLRDKKTLEAAVQHISYFPYYQKLSNIISLSTKKIEAIETKKTREANKHNAAVQGLVADIESLNRKINTEEENSKKLEQNISLIEAALADDETKYSGFTQFSSLVSRYKDTEKEILKLNNEISAYDKQQRELLPNQWIMRGIDSMVNQSMEIIKNYTEEENSVPEKKFLDDPGREKLQNILDSGQCFVCGSRVHPEDDTYKWIVRRMQEQEDYLREQEDFINTMQEHKQFTMFVGRIFDFPGALLVPLSKIEQQWQDSEDCIEKIRAKRSRLIEAKNKLDEQIEDIKRKLGVDPIKQVDEAGVVETNIRISRRNLDKQKTAYTASQQAIKDYRSLLKEKSAELKKLGENDASIAKVPETEWKNISIFLEDICKRVQENARKELLTMIEERANKFYQKFTEHDDGYKGCVKINDDYSIEPDAGLNTSHDDRKKMSIINALLSLNQDAIGTFYPFISDAPTSNFDDETTHKYLLGIKDIFGQSIIITKDVIIDSPQYDELASSANVSRIYELQSQRFCADTAEPQIYEVATLVKKLK